MNHIPAFCTPDQSDGNQSDMGVAKQSDHQPFPGMAALPLGCLDLCCLMWWHLPLVALEHLKYGESELRCGASIKHTYQVGKI